MWSTHLQWLLELYLYVTPLPYAPLLCSLYPLFCVWHQWLQEMCPMPSGTLVLSWAVQRYGWVVMGGGLVGLGKLYFRSELCPHMNGKGFHQLGLISDDGRQAWFSYLLYTLMSASDSRCLIDDSWHTICWTWQIPGAGETSRQGH